MIYAEQPQITWTRISFKLNSFEATTFRLFSKFSIWMPRVDTESCRPSKLLSPVFSHPFLMSFPPATAPNRIFIAIPTEYIGTINECDARLLIYLSLQDENEGKINCVPYFIRCPLASGKAKFIRIGHAIIERNWMSEIVLMVGSIAGLV